MEKNHFFDLFNNLGISNQILLDLAFETGLIKRQRKITPSDFLHVLCLESSKGIVSHNDIAARLEAISIISISKVAIWKKYTSNCLEFLKKVLELLIKNKLKNETYIDIQAGKSFGRILIQDSTIISLPSRLFEHFSGVSNGHSQVCNARIQGTYDILNEQFISFSVDSYSKNDLDAAQELKIKIGDLVLRDRGYLKTDEIQRHINEQAHCIYRYRIGMILLCAQSDKPINLLNKLKRHRNIDMMIKLNNREKTLVRLIAFPVPKKLADIRRRKAKIENRYYPKSEYLEILGWSIFITTIPKEEADSQKIFNFYSLRWRIETIFKSWKSKLSFDKIHNVSQIQLWIILYARFILIVICFQWIFRPCKIIVKANLHRDLSILKVINYLIKNTEKMIHILSDLLYRPTELTNSIHTLAKFCCYDKRQRLNFEQVRIEYVLS